MTLTKLFRISTAPYQNGAGDVNEALADLTSVAQQGINAFYNLINSAISLAEGLSIPVAQIRNEFNNRRNLSSRFGTAVHCVAIVV